MSVSSINSNTATYAADSYKSSNASTASKASESTEGKEASAAATYEASKQSGTSKTTTYKKEPNAAVVEQLKAASEQKTASFRKMVEDMFARQGQTIGKGDSMWRMLAKGNFTVTPEEAAQAQKDISEDGYWGVKQTSERIFSFAEALSGGDPEKMEKMRAAFEKGFKQATKAWGEELPGISGQTYDAVMKKFDDYGKTEETVIEE